jgi:CRP-like cAMP-binding protein
MYLVLEGELRALSMIDNKETTLTTMAVGEAFGEVSLLDHGPRSVDVVANADSTLLRISAEALKRLLAESPQVAAAFMTALARSMATRMRQLTKRYEDSIHFARTSGAIH